MCVVVFANENLCLCTYVYMQEYIFMYVCVCVCVCVCMFQVFENGAASLLALVLGVMDTVLFMRTLVVCAWSHQGKVHFLPHSVFGFVVGVL